MHLQEIFISSEWLKDNTLPVHFAKPNSIQTSPEIPQVYGLAAKRKDLVPLPFYYNSYRQGQNHRFTLSNLNLCYIGIDKNNNFPQPLIDGQEINSENAQLIRLWLLSDVPFEPGFSIKSGLLFESHLAVEQFTQRFSHLLSIHDYLHSAFSKDIDVFLEIPLSLRHQFKKELKAYQRFANSKCSSQIKAFNLFKANHQPLISPDNSQWLGLSLSITPADIAHYFKQTLSTHYAYQLKAAHEVVIKLMSSSPVTLKPEKQRKDTSDLFSFFKCPFWFKHNGVPEDKKYPEKSHQRNSVKMLHNNGCYQNNPCFNINQEALEFSKK